MTDQGSGSTAPDMNSDAKPRPFRSKYQNLIDMGYSLTVNEDESLAVVEAPGPSFESFDVYGNCKIWSIMRLMGACRYFAYHYPLDKTGHSFMDYGQMTDGMFTFMASSQFEIEKSMYDRHVSKWPVKVKVQLGYIGKSSTNSVSSLIVPSTGETLVRNVNQIVAIDKETRKPTPFPSWWKEKHGEKAVRKEPLIVQKLSKPDNAHTYTLRVSWSETDMYNHVNWASYVVFSIDALHHGIKEGVLRGMNKEVVKNGIQRMQMAYFGECVEGDQLTVYFWEVEDQPRTVYFAIERDGTSVFQNTLTYHQ
ncbi:uncharacterized protein LOC124272481 isoform X2 [Haliotis rubra]|uniref:uncharacterized protein LOC124272481 isoform X1 n=1 Tax=Haliotis rubra TaxID=36100 RepID=UPI001EE51093|nr:uncharacterized protein LOC124272481 isoform X1 [Haliotis rubra]XP_046563619.1 uncharacterized protein LOC124272481 isoform X2 [Haliotis rubra]